MRHHVKNGITSVIYLTTPVIDFSKSYSRYYDKFDYTYWHHTHRIYKLFFKIPITFLVIILTSCLGAITKQLMNKLALHLSVSATLQTTDGEGVT
jgi:hypothetical protein